MLARAAMTMQIANKAADCAAFKLNGVKACTAAAGNNMVQVCRACSRAPLSTHPLSFVSLFPVLSISIFPPVCLFVSSISLFHRIKGSI
jgi:hypothetical protein